MSETICPNCGGAGSFQVEVVRMAHHPSCDGGASCSRLCPVPEQDFDIEVCDMCGGSGTVEESAFREVKDYGQNNG